MSSAFAYHRMILISCILLVSAVWLDVIVGVIAKKRDWTKTKDNIELEGFADFSCFCLTPMILTWAICNSWLATASASIFLLAGIYRIARFNIEGTDRNGRYVGLPVTYNGYIFPLAALGSYSLDSIDPLVCFSSICVLLAILMASRRLRIPEF
jgi:CDP-diacylglycerol--serine O-phosphatidyltransferase